MSSASESNLPVLHALRLKGCLTADVMADLLGRPTSDVSEDLERLDRVGLVRYLSGASGGWTLTGVGRTEGERLLSNQLDAAGARRAVNSAFDAFTELNPRLLELCTRWQIRSSAPTTSGQTVSGQTASGPTAVVNDHRDHDYDLRVVEDLMSLDEAVRPICEAMANRIPRFCSYRPRFTHALDMVTMGRIDWFAKPGIDSYHSVWFELHEDLLATLGLKRGEGRDGGDRPSAPATEPRWGGSAAVVSESATVVSDQAVCRKEP